MKERINQNLIYIIDDQFRIVYTNDELMTSTTNNIQLPCYLTLCNQNEPCQKCPLKSDNNCRTIIYNQLHQQWMSVSSSSIHWPGIGHCHLIISAKISDEIGKYFNQTNNFIEYSELIELNYLNDTFHVIHSTKHHDQLTDSIKEAVIKLAENKIVVEDREEYYKLWQIDHVGKPGIPKALFLPCHKEFRIINEDGKIIWVQQLLIPTQRSTDDSIFIMSFYNVINALDTTDNFLNLNKHFGLYNRQQFLQLVENIIKNDKGKTDCCILAIDIEKFKLFNEWYGLEAGDNLLTDIAKCLQSYQNEFRIAGHFGDDDFAFFMECDELLINQICDDISQQIKKHTGKLNVLPCFGINKITCSNETPLQIYDRAKLASEETKENYISRIKWFDLEMLQSLQSELLLLSDIQEAFKNNEFYFVLQPKCNLKTGKIVGAEALARWYNKDKGHISPGVFIPFLEKSGLITELDKLIWDGVCQWQRSMLDRKKQCVPVSVNISRIDIFTIDVATHFKHLIQKYDLDPSLIELEITESAYSENIENINAIITELRRMNFKVLMDDFGSAYSSLNMLNDVTMDVIKMDMRFLQWKEENASKAVDILQTICNMAHMLGLDIVAEGVETEQQKNLLIKNGCLTAQGFYFYRPLIVADFEQELLNHIANYSEYFVEETNDELFYLSELMNENILNRDMIDNMLGAVAFYDVFDKHIEIIRYNQKYVDLLHEIDTKTETKIYFGAQLYEEDFDSMHAMFSEAQMNRHQGATIDIRRKKVNGQDMWLHLHVFFLYQRDGHSIFYSTVRDVTEIHLTNRVLDFLNNDMPGGYFRHKNNTDSDFTHISQRFLDIFGYTRNEIKELFNDKFINMVHPDDRQRVIHSLEAMKQTGGICSQPCRMLSKGGYISVLDQCRLVKYENIEIVQGIVLYNLNDYIGLNDESLYEENDSLATTLIPCGIYQSEADDDHRFNYISNSMLHMLGYTRQSFDEKFKNKTDNLVYYKDRERITYEVREQIKLSNVVICVFRIELPDGSLKWFNSFGKMVIDSQGKRWFYSCITDYDYLKEKELHQAWQLEKYKSLVEIPGAIVYDYDPLADRITVEMTDAKGRKGSYIAENYFKEIDVHGLISADQVDEQRQLLFDVIHAPQQGITQFKGRFDSNKDYQWYRFHYSSLVDENGKVYRVVGRGENITKEKGNIYELQQKAMKDSLTNLLNYESFRMIVSDFVKLHDFGSLILVDIDEFKKVNDTYGHLVGDELLIGITKILTNFFQSDDVLSRFGGDEFLIFIPKLIDKEMLNKKMTKFLTQLSQQHLVKELTIHCSIGISMVHKHLSFDELFNQADKALYQSKNNGKNTFTIYQ